MYELYTPFSREPGPLGRGLPQKVFPCSKKKIIEGVQMIQDPGGEKITNFALLIPRCVINNGHKIVILPRLDFGSLLEDCITIAETTAAPGRFMTHEPTHSLLSILIVLASKVGEIKQKTNLRESFGSSNGSECPKW